MAPASILELEEARQRLQQIERDQTEILELIARLRQIGRAMEAQVRAAEERGEAAEAQLARGRSLVERLAAGLASLEAQGQDGAAHIDRARQQLAAAFAEHAQRLQERYEQWMDQQRSLLDALRRQMARRTMALGAAATIAILIAGGGIAGRAWEARGERDRDRSADVSLPSAAADHAPLGSPASVPQPARMDLDAARQPRTWTDYLGRTAEAVLEGFHDGRVYLRSVANGRTYPIPLEGLSAGDRQYVESLRRIQQAKTAESAGELRLNAHR